MSWLDPDGYYLTWYDALLHNEYTWIIIWLFFLYLAYKGMRKFFTAN